MTNKYYRAGIDLWLRAIIASLLVICVTTLAQAQDAVLGSRDLTDVAKALLGKGPESKKYIGRKFAGIGKFRSASPSGPRPTEIEYADFATKGRIAKIDEVHVMCINPTSDFSRTVLEANAHSVPAVLLSGLIDSGYSTDSEGIIVAFVKMKDCAVTKARP